MKNLKKIVLGSAMLLGLTTITSCDVMDAINSFVGEVQSEIQTNFEERYAKIYKYAEQNGYEGTQDEWIQDIISGNINLTFKDRCLIGIPKDGGEPMILMDMMDFYKEYGDYAYEFYKVIYPEDNMTKEEFMELVKQGLDDLEESGSSSEAPSEEVPPTEEAKPTEEASSEVK